MDVVKLRKYKTSSEYQVNVPAKLVKEYNLQDVERFFVSVIDNKIIYEPVIKPGGNHE